MNLLEYSLSSKRYTYNYFNLRFYLGALSDIFFKPYRSANFQKFFLA
ncbi:MPPV-007 conserved hypothetical protein [Magpiepox virus 2]|nr:MPPV-007 conserved hypothetical protein [Magpiepox virus 2]QZW33677.1 MPPV-007 conserved hypothetical protein [Magpiepox virus 2]